MTRAKALDWGPKNFRFRYCLLPSSQKPTPHKTQDQLVELKGLGDKYLPNLWYEIFERGVSLNSRPGAIHPVAIETTGSILF